MDSPRAAFTRRVRNWRSPAADRAELASRPERDREGWPSPRPCVSARRLMRSGAHAAVPAPRKVRPGPALRGARLPSSRALAAKTRGASTMPAATRRWRIGSRPAGGRWSIRDCGASSACRACGSPMPRSISRADLRRAPRRPDADDRGAGRRWRSRTATGRRRAGRRASTPGCARGPGFAEEGGGGADAPDAACAIEGNRLGREVDRQHLTTRRIQRPVQRHIQRRKQMIQSGGPSSCSPCRVLAAGTDGVGHRRRRAALECLSGAERQTLVVPWPGGRRARMSSAAWWPSTSTRKQLPASSWSTNVPAHGRCEKRRARVEASPRKDGYHRSGTMGVQRSSARATFNPNADGREQQSTAGAGQTPTPHDRSRFRA